MGANFSWHGRLGEKKNLIDVCARQWAESVNEADKAFENMPESQWHQIKYEDFVTTPKAVLENIITWVDPDIQSLWFLEI